MKVNEIISSVKDGTKEFLENFVKYGKTSVITVILSLVIALSACLAVFFALGFVFLKIADKQKSLN